MPIRFQRRSLPWAIAAGAWMARAQNRSPLPPDTAPGEDTQLPNGKSQKDEILKAEREQNLKDAAQLVDLAEQLQREIEKNDRFVLSLATLKKADEIEKLAKKIRSRMRHS